jgi:glyoxylase-like metal-dependent hydrolase (beta-lactamase superfamily II)
MDRFSHGVREEIMMNTFVEVAPGVAFLRCAMVNVAAIGDRASWILLDTGLPGYAAAIHEAAVARFGNDARPDAIVLSHGHFDHVGSLHALLDVWPVPVHAHPLEMPYLTGRSPYPPPDPLVGGGSMALISRLYPRGPIDLGSRVSALPSGGRVPAMAEWRWIHTPGHTPGHISLFRDRDRTLLSADALITTKQESALAVLQQRCELHGPPAYFTPDWDAARDSLRALAALHPELIVAGHGQPWGGREMRERLAELAADFDAMERPRFGRYAKQPAIADERGVVMVPPDPLPPLLAGAAALAATAGLVWMAQRHARADLPEGSA